MKKNSAAMALPLLFLLSGAGCAKVQVAPVEIKPIHITVDVNVKIDRALENFFSDIDKGEVKK